MADPILLFENFLDKAGAVFTSTADAAGFPKENVLDWRVGMPYRWKSDGVGDPVHLTVDLGSGNDLEADCFGFAGHNFIAAKGNCAPLIAHADAGGGPWTTALDTVTPPTDIFPRLFIISGSPGAHRYWRVELEQPLDDLQVGVMVIGRRLDLPGAMMNLDPYGEEANTKWSHNEGGELLGANYRFLEKRFNLSYRDGDAPSRDGFFTPASGIGWDDDFLPHARKFPFLFAWNIDVDADDVFLCRVRRRIRMDFRSSTQHRNLTLALESFAGQR